MCIYKLCGFKTKLCFFTVGKARLIFFGNFIYEYTHFGYCTSIMATHTRAVEII